MMREYLSRFAKWKGWKKIFPFPAWVEILVFIACGAGLVWVFVNGLELWWPSYILYGLSAYALTVAMGIYMIRRANREIKTLQEKQNGK